MLLFTRSRQVGFALSIAKLKIKNKKCINLSHHQNSAIFADTGSPVINDIRIFFRWALQIYPFETIKKINDEIKYNNDNKKNSPVTANFCASNRLTLVFLGCLEVSGNQQKPKRNYMAAGELVKYLFF